MQELRKRYAPSLKPEQVSQLAQCQRPTVTRLENGSKVASAMLIASLLNIYNATPDERDEALRLRQLAAQATAVVEHAADLSPRYLVFRYDEADAVLEQTIDHITVPGIFQIAGYAAALAKAGQPLSRGENWLERAAEERQSRQKLLTRDDPIHVHSLIDEAVLRRLVGGREIMTEQLHRLITLGKLPHITIQVVPYNAGAWGTMTGTATILNYEEGPASVYVDDAAGGESVEGEDDVHSFMELFSQALHVALTPTESMKVIGMVIQEL